MQATIDQIAWVPVREYARRKDLSVDYVRQLAREGKVTSVRVGGRYLIYDEPESQN